jgi:hypothetical protein
LFFRRFTLKFRRLTAGVVKMPLLFSCELLKPGGGAGPGREKAGATE